FPNTVNYINADNNFQIEFHQPLQQPTPTTSKTSQNPPTIQQLLVLTQPIYHTKNPLNNKQRLPTDKSKHLKLIKPLKHLNKPQLQHVTNKLNSPNTLTDLS
ncbi:GA module-containing protein, partial [Staphylococcus epidermidis]|uniref:GA module-containing protein n=1 Tax=Staphylococcus epidermidis TaxID=1282 RepID=UPI001642BF93